ncbi:MAG: hypothetical protein MRY74_10140, partial [Neomegalonema sp.]|nr:hypothetical protein [Neomegalonema sp.]
MTAVGATVAPSPSAIGRLSGRGFSAPLLAAALAAGFGAAGAGAGAAAGVLGAVGDCGARPSGRGLGARGLATA